MNPPNPKSTSLVAAADSSFLTAVHLATGLAMLRVLSSYSWLSGVFWGKDAKFHADFLDGSGLAQRIVDPVHGFIHTALTPRIAALLHDTVLPHAARFACMIALSELVIGISMLLGLLARLGGVLAILRAMTNILVAGGGSPDAVEHNYMLALAGFVVVVCAAGRAYGMDHWLIQHWPRARWLRLLA
jgi:uncharacterized membrane protein YphA (DoxX/SURF4 family)